MSQAIISGVVVAGFIIATLHAVVFPLHNDIQKSSRAIANCIKGMMAVLIVLSHVHNYYSNIGLIKIFTPFGYIGVTVFFFYSGYGVAKNTWENASYLDDYWVKRLLKIYVPYIVATIIYIVVLPITGQALPKICDVVIALSAIKRLLPYSWYVFIVLLWYLLWYFCSKMAKDQKYTLVAVSVVLATYFIVCGVLEVGPFYYKSIICLWIGVYFAYTEKVSNAAFNSNVWIILIAGALFILSVFGLYKYDRYDDIIYSMIVSISSASFIVIVQCCLSKGLKFYNNVANFLGNISYEIYLLQGPVFILCKNVCKENFALFLPLSLMGLIVISYIISIIDKKAIALIKSLR